MIDLLLRGAETDDVQRREVLLGQAVKAIESLRSDELKDYLKVSCLPENNLDLGSLIRQSPNAAVVYLVDLPDRIAMVLARGDGVTHYRSGVRARQAKAEAFLLADQVLLLRAGTVQQYGSSSELRDSPANDFVREFVEAESR